MQSCYMVPNDELLRNNIFKKKKKPSIKDGVTPTNEKIRENHLRWFGQVQRRVVKVPMSKSDLM